MAKTTKPVRFIEVETPNLFEGFSQRSRLNALNIITEYATTILADTLADLTKAVMVCEPADIEEMLRHLRVSGEFAQSLQGLFKQASEHLEKALAESQAQLSDRST